ncbi:MAG: hypothetical protein HOM38_09165, partial [Euryarchaeota archaeon]|nr:hypothetical protein [Euryarchaeota archaeon]
MSKLLQLRGGTTAEHTSFTGAVREVTVDTDKDTLVVHDGTTAGGHVLPRTKADIDALNINADTLDGKQLATIESEYQAFANTAAANVVDSAPGTLDTLNELAAALGDDPNFATTVTNSIGTKLNASSYTAADVLTKIKTVDGSGSGLDADLWDGQQFSSYLNQAVLSTSNPTFNSVYVNNDIIHNGDSNTYLGFGTDTINLVTGGSGEVTVDTTGVRLGDSGNGYFRPVSGDYGSIEIGSGAHSGWEGYSIGGRIVFMHDNNLDYGLYDDVSNQWGFQAVRNGLSRLFFNGSAKLTTTSSGADTSGTHTATNFNTTSDATLKTNVETLTGSLDAVKAMRGVSFDWIENGNSEVGVIAQEVEA